MFIAKIYFILDALDILPLSLILTNTASKNPAPIL